MKESFYFPHDYNAHEDEKIIKLLRKYGHEGYGIYWHIVELLAASSEARLKISDIEDVAYAMRLECERIKDIIFNFNLFKNDETFFYSPRLAKFFKEKSQKSDKARKSAKARWYKENNTHANAMRTQCERNAIKERRGKDKKGNKSNTMSKEDFEKFWGAYPLRKDRIKAEEKFMRLPKDLLPTILESIESQKKEKIALKERKEFCPEWKHPTTWINGGCWEDEPYKPLLQSSGQPEDYNLEEAKRKL